MLFRSEVMTDGVLLDKYGIVGRQYADFATFRGDPSDGLPGVSGVGEKTAAGLVSTYGSLTGVLDAATQPNSPLKPAVRTKIMDSLSYLECASQVVRVRTDAPLPRSIRVPTQIADPDGLAAISADWGVDKHVARLLSSLGMVG